MIDPDLKIELDKLNVNLAEINKKSGKAGVWRSFFNGAFSALGYVAGLAVVVVILGWVLQRTGLLPAFEAQVKNFTDLVNSARELIITDDKKPAATNLQPVSGGQTTTVTLPNGQQVKVQIPQQ